MELSPPRQVRRHGPEALDTVIVSGTTSADDVARVALIGAVPLLLDLGYPLIVAYACVFCAATFGAIFNPARIAIIPQLVVPDSRAAMPPAA